MQNRQQKLRLLLALTKRDYVVQFAGAGLGIGWLFIQYLFQIALFYLIFGVVLGGDSSDLGLESRRLTGPGFLNYLLGAMTLWLPLSEMIQRSGSILSENRALIRRTPGALDAMSAVPLLQGLFHFTILFVASSAIAWLGPLLGPVSTANAATGDGYPPFSFILAYGTGILFLLICFPLSLYLQRTSVLLKDLSPILRLLLQILFWSTPMVYVIHRTDILSIMSWNPLFCMVDVQRYLSYGLDLQITSFAGLICLVLLSGLAGLLSRFRLREVSADFL